MSLRAGLPKSRPGRLAARLYVSRFLSHQLLLASLIVGGAELRK